jgi:two-component sensor histidine kinase
VADFDPFYFLQGGGKVEKTIREIDWSATPLGPIESWPIALKTTISTILNSRFPAALTWGPEMTTIYNDAFRPILGNKPEAMGRPFSEVWSEVWEEIRPIALKAYAGEATFIENAPLQIIRFGAPEQAFFTFCYSPLRDDQGRVAGMLDTVIETTSKVATERTFRILNSELHHRIKNTLALVNSIVSQTLRRAQSIEQVRDVLMQRLAALATAHEILTGNGPTQAAIDDVVSAAMSPHDSIRDQFSMSGPALPLSEKEALSLALAINELATNSVKYGALKEPEGRVSIDWTLNEDAETRQFRFAWKESGGPPVAVPERKGFGSMLIERVVPHDFGGTATLTYDPAGLRYEIAAERRAAGEAKA